MKTDNRDARLEELFAAAKDLPASEQELFVEHQCEDDLRATLRGLLSAYGGAPKQDFANRILPENVVLRSYEAALSTDTEPTEAIARGRKIGPYKILQLLGEGGMGTVYMAEQAEPVARRVALKVIKRGMDSREVLARFDAERQALSMMDHPNIAKVLDAGVTDSGRPYFVMELVKGLPITRFCDKQKLPAKRRLELFISVCKAVAHAHQKGVIHRDIKPSNVIVAAYDDQAVPKIIDFGVAKATTKKLTEKTLFTQYGQLVGTVEYMSPEQAKLNQLDVDTRSDIYSLGVLLYELLAGTTPFDRGRLRSAAFNEMLRIITEEEPPRPSTKLTAQDNGSAIAESRKIDPKALARMLRGELDWIVMKALEKDRKRRYQGANDFAKDIERYLEGEAVEAGPPSAKYRLSKFARRYRRPLAAVAAVLLLLSIATVISGIQWLRAIQSAEAEAQQREQAEAASGMAEAARQRAESALRLSTALRLVSSESQRSNRPIRSLLLALEAAEMTRQSDGKANPIVHETLLNAMTAVAGEPLIGHQGDFERVAMSADGSSFATASLDGTVRVWDLSENKPSTHRCTLRGHTDTVATISYSPNGLQLATASEDGTVRIWDSDSPDPQSTVKILAGRPGLSYRKPLVFSDSGDLLAAAGPDDNSGQERVYTVNVWNITADNPAWSQRVLRHHTDFVLDAVFSHDGRWLYTGGRDRTICVWDLSKPASLSPVQIERLPGYVTKVALSPDGNVLATRSWESRLGTKLWSVSENARISPLETLAGTDDFAFGPSGRWLALLERPDARRSENQVVFRGLLSADPNSPVRVLPAAGVSPDFGFIGFSKDDNWFLARADDGSSHLWDLRAAEFAKIRFSGGHDGLASWAMSPNADWLVSASPIDKTARIWDLSRKLPAESAFLLPGPAERKSDNWIAISPDDRWLASTTKEGGVQLCELKNEGPRAIPFSLGNEDESITALCFGPESRRLYTGNAEGTVKVWDITARGTSMPVLTLPGNAEGIRAIAVSPNGQSLAVGAWTEGVRLWNLSNPEHAYVLDAVVNKLAFSGNSRWLLTGLLYNQELDTATKLWDLSRNDPSAFGIALIGQSAYWSMHDIELSADGRWLVAGSENRTVLRYDLDADDPIATAKLLRTMDAPVRAVAVTVNGQRVCASSWFPEQNELWALTDDPDPIREVRLLRPADRLGNAAFSPDGQWLVRGADDGTVHLWDMKTESAEHFALSHMVLGGHRGAVSTIEFTTDGRWMITSDVDTIRVWPLELNALINIARRLAGRRLTEEEKKLLAF